MRRLNARVAAPPQSSSSSSSAESESESIESMDNNSSIKLKFRPNQYLRSTNLFSRTQKQQSHISKSSLFVIGFVTLVIASCCYYYVNLNNEKNENKDIDKQYYYRIVIDGGSTGTRIHVFEFMIDDHGVPFFDFSGRKGLGSMRVSPGLSGYSDDPDRASESVLELLKFARKRIPEGKWGESEVRLMATAGLRMLDLSLQERILESCRKVLRSSGFVFRNEWASVISGILVYFEIYSMYLTYTGHPYKLSLQVFNCSDAYNRNIWKLVTRNGRGLS